MGQEPMQYRATGSGNMDYRQAAGFSFSGDV